MSDRAKLIKIADKACNVHDLAHSPPADWSAQRQAEYLDWARQVVDGCRGTNQHLERYFDEVLTKGAELLRVSIRSSEITNPM
jgi:hypothetical protein